ncbi:FAD dependent oxidoreductase [Cristinia sonorae]|uniref:FAD dependent oxidoreductase n=1 Tax=Cristinia sonorae TaxID=1940300 RepID=A0A8K0XS44_9AGAR|nr:FAD dependent oxidoreductase [Cristinia sonorae]
MQKADKRVLIIGGGVTGMTTAWALLDAGYSVTIMSDRWASMSDRITSQIAGALWEYPPAVCGRHTDKVSILKSKKWCMTSYRVFEKLQKILPERELPDHGIRMRMSNFFFDKPIEQTEDEYEKMVEISTIPEIRGFKRDANLVKEHAVNQKAGVVDSYQHIAPAIDTDSYMTWLRFIVACKGAQFVTDRVDGDLLAQEEELLEEFDAQAIIQCTGLSGAELAGDESVYPLRGALIRVVNDGSKFPKVTEALVVAHDYAKRDEDGGIVFIVPRNDRTLILGGLAQPHKADLDLTLDSPEIRRMRDRCNRFVPGLENADYDPEAPLVQGLRPFRGKNVRVERELRRKEDGSFSKIIHSYGQGGAGFTLSFGCAGDVLALLEEAEAGVAPKST